MIRTWVVAAFFVTLVTAAGHYHDIDDTNLTHECTICSVVSHTDDVDNPGIIAVAPYQRTAVSVHPADWTAGPSSPNTIPARGPPVS